MNSSQDYNKLPNQPDIALPRATITYGLTRRYPHDAGIDKADSNVKESALRTTLQPGSQREQVRRCEAAAAIARQALAELPNPEIVRHDKAQQANIRARMKVLLEEVDLNRQYHPLQRRERPILSINTALGRKKPKVIKEVTASSNARSSTSSTSSTSPIQASQVTKKSISHGAELVVRELGRASSIFPSGTEETKFHFVARSSGKREIAFFTAEVDPRKVVSRDDFQRCEKSEQAEHIQHAETIREVIFHSVAEQQRFYDEAIATHKALIDGRRQFHDALVRGVETSLRTNLGLDLSRQQGSLWTKVVDVHANMLVDLKKKLNVDEQALYHSSTAYTASLLENLKAAKATL